MQPRYKKITTADIRKSQMLLEQLHNVSDVETALSVFRPHRMHSFVSPVKTGEPIEMAFGGLPRVNIR